LERYIFLDYSAVWNSLHGNRIYVGSRYGFPLGSYRHLLCCSMDIDLDNEELLMVTTFDKLGRAIVKALEEEGLEIVLKEDDAFYTKEQLLELESIEDEYMKQEYD